MSEAEDQTEQGRQAFQHSVPLMDNPYANYSIPWYAWRKGWFWESYRHPSTKQTVEPQHRSSINHWRVLMKNEFGVTTQDGSEGYTQEDGEEG